MSTKTRVTKAKRVTRPRTENPLLYSERYLKWAATDLLEPDENFRLDVATDMRDGTVRAVRIVPTTLFGVDADGNEFTPEISLSALKSLTVSRLGAAANAGAADQDDIPAELRQRIDELLASNTLKRRPSMHDSRALPWHQAVLDLRNWATQNGLAPSGVVSRAFSLHFSTADRWLREAETVVEGASV